MCAARTRTRYRKTLTPTVTIVQAHKALGRPQTPPSNSDQDLSVVSGSSRLMVLCVVRKIALASAAAAELCSSAPSAIWP